MATTSIIKGKGERRGISQRSDPPPNEGATHWGGAARGPGRTTTSTAPAEFASRENTCTRRSPRRPKLDTRSSVAFLTCYRKFTITAAPTESITNHTTTARLGVAPATQSVLRTWLADTFVSSHLRSTFISSQCTLQLLGVHTIVSLEPSSTPVSLSQQHSHSSAPPLRHSEPEYLSTQHTHTSSEPTRWTSRTSNTLMTESFMPADTKPPSQRHERQLTEKGVQDASALPARRPRTATVTGINLAKTAAMKPWLRRPPGASGRGGLRVSTMRAAPCLCGLGR